MTTPKKQWVPCPRCGKGMVHIYVNNEDRHLNPEIAVCCGHVFKIEYGDPQEPV